MVGLGGTAWGWPVPVVVGTGVVVFGGWWSAPEWWSSAGWYRHRSGGLRRQVGTGVVFGGGSPGRGRLPREDDRDVGGHRDAAGHVPPGMIVRSVVGNATVLSAPPPGPSRPHWRRPSRHHDAGDHQHRECSPQNDRRRRKLLIRIIEDPRTPYSTEFPETPRRKCLSSGPTDPGNRGGTGWGAPNWACPGDSTEGQLDLNDAFDLRLYQQITRRPDTGRILIRTGRGNTFGRQYFANSAPGGPTE